MFVFEDILSLDETSIVITSYSIHYTKLYDLGDRCTLLEERRRFYKLDTDLNASIALLTRENEDIVFEEPVFGKFKNINVGGVFLVCNYKFKPDDIIVLSFKVLGKELDLPAKVLRIQMKDNQVEGYGCNFLKLKNYQEEVLARYIHKKQAERLDGLKNTINSR